MKFHKKIAVILAAIMLVASFAAVSASAGSVDMGAPLSEYFQDIAVDYAFDKATDYSALGFKTDSGAVYEHVIGVDGANSYVTSTNAAGAQHFIQPNPMVKWMDVVAEFDMAFLEMPVSGGINMQITGPTPTSSRSFATLTGIGLSNIGSQSVTWTAGEWKRICIVVNTTDDTFTTYYKDTLTSEYVLIETKSYGVDLTAAISEFRFNNTFKGGLVAYDNIAVYEGTEPRDYKAINKDSTDIEKFIFMAPYLESEFLPDVQYAYENMGTILPTLSADTIAANAKLKSAVDTFNAFDYNTVKQGIMNYNQGIFDGYVVDLNALIRKYDNMPERESLVAAVEQFVSRNAFDVNSTAYKSAYKVLQDRRTELSNDYLIQDFIKKMQKFEMAPVADAMEKHYNDALTVSNSGLDATILDDTNLNQYYTVFAKYYEMFNNAKNLIQAVVNDDNSERFVNQMNHLATYDNYNTEAVWVENYDKFNLYITYSRGVLASGAYNPDFAGFTEALAIYKPINDYFYAILQSEHVNALTEILAQYPKTDSYVAKLGICRSANNYLSNNDIQEEHTEIAALIAQLGIYEEEVALLRDAYLETLESNTAYFLGYVAQMDATRGYAALKSLYEKAGVYYHSLNAGTDEVVAALDSFDAYGEYLDSVAYDSEQFLKYANGIATKTGNELYLALAGCYRHRDNVSTDISGVSAAITAYETALAAYEADTALINSEIAESGAVVCSVYFSSAVKPVMKVVHKIF